MLRHSSDVLRPVKIVLANDFSFDVYFEYSRWKKPFQIMYWHNRKQLGYGNVLFVDSHVQYLQATLKAPDFQRGNGWSFIYND
jgi:prepilin-type processing-associated H-X9-DG protein